MTGSRVSADPNVRGACAVVRPALVAALVLGSTLVMSCLHAGGKRTYVDHAGTEHAWPAKHYLVEVTTVPEDAPININGEFVGKSPLKSLVPKSRVRNGIHVEALPFEPGQHGQQRRIDVAGRRYDEPIRVYFNMAIDRVTPTQRFEID